MYIAKFFSMRDFESVMFLQTCSTKLVKCLEYAG